MPNKTGGNTGGNTGDLKSRIDQIAEDGPALPDDQRVAAATASPAHPATDAVAPPLVLPEEPGPRAGTPAASASEPAAAPAPRTRKKRAPGTQITVRVEKEMHAQLKQMAIDEDRSVEAVVRRTLRDAIAAHEARKAGSGSDARS